MFVSCISGQRARANEVSLHNTGAIVSMAVGLDFNFSIFILNGMVGNIEGKGKNKFLMFPRFLQMIFNNKHPEIMRRGETLNVKSLGANTFSLMKQNRKGKFMFEGKYPLVNLGQFAEDRDSSSIESSFEFIETEDDVITTSEHKKSEFLLL